ncbi:urotensin-2 receptor-like, partial [Hypanus sabinus]|uniref:urotensin-2 receptor-like n=1 Tax=Hypanus sabinus TaxID=79690 RepID=UPI0028C4F627
MGSMLGPNLSCFWCRGRLSLPEGLWSTWAPPDTDSDSPWVQRQNRTSGPHSNSSPISSWAPGLEVWDWEWEEEEEGHSRGWSPSWLTGALLWLACGVGLAGNLYALGLGCCRGDRGSRLRLHLRSLAASDLLYLCTAPFAGYGAWSRDWAFGETGCRLLLGLDICTMHASAFTLVLMSAQRYRAISRPLRGPLSPSGSSSTAAALLAAWMTALALSLPVATAVRVEEGDSEGGGRRLCAPGWSQQESRGYLTLLFITSSLVPGLLIAGLYAGLARAYCRARRRWRRQAWPARGAGRRPLLLTLAVVLSHWLCFLPFWLWQLAPLYLEGAALPFPAQGLVNDLLSVLTYANSCLDPFLYTLLTQQHRRAERPQAKGGGRVVRLRQGQAGGDGGGGGQAGDSGQGEGDHAGGGNSDSRRESKPTDGPNVTE